MPYPDPDVVVVDPTRFKAKINNSVIERLYVGCRWAEGIAWNGNAQCVIWSDIPNNRQLRRNEEDGHVSVMRPSANYSNGNTFDYQGRQLSCEQSLCEAGKSVTPIDASRRRVPRRSDRRPRFALSGALPNR